MTTTTTTIWRGLDAEGRRTITIANLPAADRCTLIVSRAGDDEPSTALVLSKATLADLAETLRRTVST